MGTVPIPITCEGAEDHRGKLLLTPELEQGAACEWEVPGSCYDLGTSSGL